MSRDRKDTGDWGEDLAAAHLESQGLTVLRRNVRTDAGELDLLAWDVDTLVFVEVKAFERLAPGSDPAENVHRAKQQRLARIARIILAAHRPEPYCRFDVVTLVRQPQLRIEHHKGAFILQ
jgi:putative endonuclease